MTQTRAQRIDKWNQYIIERGKLEMEAYLLNQLRANQEPLIDYDVLSDAANEALSWAIENCPEKAGLENMQEIEIALCESYGVPVSEIR